MKRMAGAAAGIAAALVLAGCAGGAEAEEATEPDEPLVVYTNSVAEGDGRQEWLESRATEAGFEIEIVALGGGDLANRLVAEKNNPQADVMFGLNNVYYERLLAEGVLAPYEPAWADKVEAGVGDDEHFWPIVREPIMGVYSLDEYPDGEGAPTDWPDLWEKEEFHGKYLTPTSLGGATDQLVVAGILARHRDDAGHLGVSEEGWQTIEAYFANGSPRQEGMDVYAQFQDGSAAIGNMWLAGKIAREEQYGVPSEAMRPEIGVPMVYQHVAIAEGTDQPEQAAEFLDWFGSAEVQGEWSKDFFTAPTNADALELGDPLAVEVTDSFAEQDIDWAWVTEHLDQWIEEIELNYLVVS